MAGELGWIAQHLVRLVPDGDPDRREGIGAGTGDVFDQAGLARADWSDQRHSLRVLERLTQQALVAAADELLEGHVQVRAVSGLGDGRERLPRLQHREQFRSGEPVQ